MSKALRFLQEGFDGPSTQAIKEWVGPSGEIGIYRSGYYDHYVLLVLVSEEKRMYYAHRYPPKIYENTVMEDAITIAMFAGIDVEESEITR